jgi:NADH dehydrogenase
MTQDAWRGKTPRVVIVGGGFGGLSAARALKRADVRVTLVDRRNHHVFQPLLYQVATAALSPADISAPIRGVLRKQRNAEVVLGEVASVAPDAKEVRLTDGTALPYDFLVVATGATHAYFGHPEWEDAAPGLKSIEDATEIRRRFLLAFEAAEREPDPAVRRALLTFVVIGAGATGVEMAGAMAEIARHSLVRDFRRIDPTSARIILLEGGSRVLAAYDPELSDAAKRMLEEIGVEVQLNSIVTDVRADRVCVGEREIPTRNVVWAAGVKASELGASLGAELDRAGRVKVRPDLSVPGRPEVFVVGDLVSLADDRGQQLPGVAPAANQMGQHAAEMILRAVRGVKTMPFRYVDKGSLATIGRRKAIMHAAGFRLAGGLAWLAWLLLHVFFLIGFRSRVVVMIQWAWSYLTWQRGARLITGELGPRLAPPGRPLGDPTAPAPSLSAGGTPSPAAVAAARATPALEPVEDARETQVE